MSDMSVIQSDVNELKSWRGVTEHRMATMEQHCKEEVKHRARLEAEFNQVDRKISRIEGAIEFIKWVIPISMSLISGIVWFLTR